MRTAEVSGTALVIGASSGIGAVYGTIPAPDTSWVTANRSQACSLPRSPSTAQSKARSLWARQRRQSISPRLPHHGRPMERPTRRFRSHRLLGRTTSVLDAPVAVLDFFQIA